MAETAGFLSPLFSSPLILLCTPSALRILASPPSAPHAVEFYSRRGLSFPAQLALRSMAPLERQPLSSESGFAI